MRLSDLLGIYKTYTLPLIRSYQAEDGCTVFEFATAGKNITWRPGQHGIFTLPTKPISGRTWRAFSISSIPSEGMVQIATKISATPSSFKQALLSLTPGESIKLRGPIGWLYLKDDYSPLVLIAGSVGITPFRALFKALALGNKRPVTLLYSARDTHLFRPELDAIAAADPQITIIYTYTKEELDAAYTKVRAAAHPTTYYYLSGVPALVAAHKKDLRTTGVSAKQIITDSFRGYN
jgi:ferredoxin-NADP reductase